MSEYFHQRAVSTDELLPPSLPSWRGRPQCLVSLLKWILVLTFNQSVEACDTITACLCLSISQRLIRTERLVLVGICTQALIIFRIWPHRILFQLLIKPFCLLVQAIDINRHLTTLKLKNFSGKFWCGNSMIQCPNYDAMLECLLVFFLLFDLCYFSTVGFNSCSPIFFQTAHYAFSLFMFSKKWYCIWDNYMVQGSLKTIVWQVSHCIHE